MGDSGKSTAARGTELTYRGKLAHVRFSNRPTEVKHFQAIRYSSVDIAHGLALLFGLGTKALPSWGFEDEVEQSFGGPRRQCDRRSGRFGKICSGETPTNG